MTTPSTEHPECPHQDPHQPKDDRHPGVYLLEHDDECKTTAELIDRRYWRVCDWELIDLPQTGMVWLPRSWHGVGLDHLQALARLTAQELAEPAPEQPSLLEDAPP